MLFFCAILIKLTSKGPLIYKQVRVGLHNKEFEMYEFRSMEVQPEADEKKGVDGQERSPVTGISKFMRRTSLDELPQLFNIFKGDMSLVGPRPERPFFNGEVPGRNTALYGETSGQARTDRLGSGKWFTGEILLSGNVSSMICIILKTGHLDLI